MALAFSGQETGIVILDTTTGDQKLDDMLAKSLNFTIKTTITESLYLGQIGPQVREFYNGYEFSLDYDPTSPITLVDFMSLVIAKSQRLILDEFAVRTKFGALDAGQFSATFADVKWDSPSFSVGGQQEVLSSTLKGQGNTIKLQRVG